MRLAELDALGCWLSTAAGVAHTLTQPWPTKCCSCSCTNTHTHGSLMHRWTHILEVKLCTLTDVVLLYVQVTLTEIVSQPFTRTVTQYVIDLWPLPQPCSYYRLDSTLTCELSQHTSQIYLPGNVFHVSLCWQSANRVAKTPILLK